MHNICILKILKTNHSLKKIISCFLTIPLNSDTDIPNKSCKFYHYFRILILNPTHFSCSLLFLMTHIPLSITSKLFYREKKIWEASHDSIEGVQGLSDDFTINCFAVRDIAKSVPSINLENFHL